MNGIYQSILHFCIKVAFRRNFVGVSIVQFFRLSEWILSVWIPSKGNIFGIEYVPSAVNSFGNEIVRTQIPSGLNPFRIKSLQINPFRIESLQNPFRMNPFKCFPYKSLKRKDSFLKGFYSEGIQFYFLLQPVFWVELFPDHFWRKLSIWKFKVEVFSSTEKALRQYSTKRNKCYSK